MQEHFNCIISYPETIDKIFANKHVCLVNYICVVQNSVCAGIKCKTISVTSIGLNPYS